MNGAAREEAVRVSSISHPWLRRLAVMTLVALGVGMVVLGAVIWLDTSAPGKSTVTKSSTTQVTKPASRRNPGGTTTTTVSSTDTTTPGNPSVRSEPLAAALFGLGALVFLTGVFFGRLEEVTLPGGAGFKLSPAAQATVVEKVAKEAETARRLEPQTLRRLY